ncbi:MAG: hypothetical protein J6L75_01910, partial [Alistipes sp.]|nr:hypothetical protein [Alistipes sp.]
MNYSQTIDYLFNSLPSFQQVGADAYKPGLERIAEFCRHLGNPQRNYYTIHVAGTNGKGSVSHILASVLQQAGYRVGLFTSPHLKDFRERIRVDGQMIPKQKVVNFVDCNRQKMEELSLSFFEMTTAMAFDYFAYSDVEVAVIETGLGGRLDATNIITPLMSVITNVGLDHTDLLGDELCQIAAEKAGIIKKSVPVVVGEPNEAYNAVIEGRAAELKSPVIYAEQLFEVVSHAAEGDKQHIALRRVRDGYFYDMTTGELLLSYDGSDIVDAKRAHEDFQDKDCVPYHSPILYNPVYTDVVVGYKAVGVAIDPIGCWSKFDIYTKLDQAPVEEGDILQMGVKFWKEDGYNELQPFGMVLQYYANALTEPESNVRVP